MWYFGPLLLAGAALGAPQPDPVAFGTQARSLPVQYGYGRAAQRVFRDTGDFVVSSSDVNGTAEASTEAYADSSGTLSVSGTSTASTESYADSTGTLSLSGTTTGSTESYADASGTVGTLSALDETDFVPPRPWKVRQPARLWWPDEDPARDTLSGTGAASTESYADATGTLSLSGTSDASTEAYADSTGTVSVSGTVDASTESYADASGTVGTAFGLDEEPLYQPRVLPVDPWAVPSPMAFGGSDLAASGLDNEEWGRVPPQMAWWTTRVVSQWQDDVPDAGAPPEPDVPAGGPQPRVLPIAKQVPPRRPIAVEDPLPAQDGSISGTVEASTESYADSTGTLVLDGTATASTESYADSTGTLALSGTASAATEPFVDSAGTVSLAGTATAATESYVDATGTAGGINGTVNASSESYSDISAGIVVPPANEYPPRRNPRSVFHPRRRYR